MLPKLRLCFLATIVALPFQILSMIVESNGAIGVGKEPMPHVFRTIVSSDHERSSEDTGNGSDSAHPSRTRRRHDVGENATGIGVGKCDVWVSLMERLLRETKSRIRRLIEEKP